ncbi:peroxiredoxin-6-like [Mixophyes fleayi]|uniref:peroxiredoxin-6-like n=1 Tax=Mixophyes fleayi TaxID=3061075 RepID=UPI003F4DC79A
MLMLGDEVPDFKADTTEGIINFHEYTKDSWKVILSHPGVFTPVCTTELAYVAKNIAQYNERKVKVIAISFDTIERYKEWLQDINVLNKEDPSKPLPFLSIADKSRDIGVMLGLIRASEKTQQGLALTARHVFIIGPDNKLKCCLIYPAATGRDMDEIIRAIDSIQLTYNMGVSTAANWKKGEKVIVPENMPPEKVQKYIKNRKVVNLPSGKSYLQYGELIKHSIKA